MIAFSTLSNAARQATMDAAFAEEFDPMALAGLDGKIDVATLRSLAAVSDEVAPRPRLAWRMRTDARLSLIADLARSGQMSAVLTDRGAEEPLFSRYLRQALRGGPLEPPATAEAREKAIVAYEVATESLANIPDQAQLLEAAKADLARLRSEASVEVEAARSRTILPGPLIGRVRERAVIQHYIDTGAVEPSLAFQPPENPQTAARPFLIVGCGGSGKSAILADIVRARRSSVADWAPVLLLDFDRPSNCVGGPAEWYSELTRQIGLGRPALGQRLKLLRAKAREDAESGTTGRASISNHVLAERLRTGLPDALAEEQALGLPLLLVFDTFEEVLTRSDLRNPESLFADLLRWSGELCHILSDAAGPVFSCVRILVSGRARPGLEAALSDWFCGEITIDALEPPDAEAFLVSRLPAGALSAQQVTRAATMVGGHPLSLILFSRFARQHPDAVDEMLAQGDLTRMLSGEDAARSLYARFLQRLHVEARDGVSIDPQKVQRVAHPGLVLREVTVDLLAEVIAPACDLELATGEAEILFQQLIDQVWLVEELKGRPIRTVRHRPDVRRLMLPMMNAASAATAPDHVDLASKVRRVRSRAVEWFTDASRSAFDQASLEAAYHRAFLDQIEGDADDARTWSGVWALAPEDVAAMPPRAAAIILYNGRGPGSLSPEQVQLLPDALRKAAAIARTDIALAAGRNREADFEASQIRSASYDEDPIPPPSGPAPTPSAPMGWLPAGRGGAGRGGAGRVRRSAPPTLYALAGDRELASEVNAAFLSGQFYKAAGIGWRAIIGMAESDLSEPLRIEEDITSHWIWRAALSRMVQPDELPTESWLTEALQRHARRDRIARHGPDSAGLALCAALSVASAGGVRPKAFDRSDLLALFARQKRISTPGEARVMSLAVQWVEGEVSMPAFLNPRLLPKAAASAVRDRLEFPAAPRARRDAVIRPYIDWREADGFELLNRRLTELEALVLGVTEPILSYDHAPLLDAVDRLGPPPPWVSPDLYPDTVRRRFGRGLGRAGLGAFIAAVNLEGALPAFLDRLAQAAPNIREFSRLAALTRAYGRVLRIC